MTTKRLAIILAMVAVGLAAIFFLPKSSAQPTGLRLTDGHPALPDWVGDWDSRPEKITDKEVETLGPGTEFSRRVYFHPTVPYLQAWTTIVLSGHDISNSLHRPERCLRAQGWDVIGSDSLDVHVEKKGSFPVTRLHNTRLSRASDGTTFSQEAYTYYWFVGEHALTGSHFGRFFTDNKDRFLRGVDQRWAFVTVTVFIPAARNPAEQPEYRRQVDHEVRDFLAKLAPAIQSDDVRYDTL